MKQRRSVPTAPLKALGRRGFFNLGDEMAAKQIEEILEMLVTRLSPQPRSDGFLSLEQAAAFLGNMPTSTLGEKARNGEVKSYKPGKSLIFDPKDLREYVKRHPKG